jgi:hypothetical protein
MILFAAKKIDNGVKMTVLGVNVLLSKRKYLKRRGFTKDESTYQVHLGLRSIYIGRKQVGSWANLFKRWDLG